MADKKQVEQITDMEVDFAKWYTDVCTKAELIDYCKAMAGRIMKNGPYAVSLAKQAINTGMDTDLDSGLKLEANLFGLSFSTADKKEGMTAFLEKRKEKHFIGK